MSTARVFKVENRLAKLVREPGGRTLIEAFRSAESKVEAVRERCLASLGPKIERLQALARSGQVWPGGLRGRRGGDLSPGQ